MDDCPVCGETVKGFEFNYNPGTTPVYDYGMTAAVYITDSSPTFTFSPCKHTVTDIKAIDWHVVRCATKKQYNKEVIRSAYRSLSKKAGEIS